MVRKGELTGANVCDLMHVNPTYLVVAHISQTSKPVADPGFSRGVRQFQNWDYFVNFLPKLHENERIRTPGVRRGGRVPGAPLLRSATEQCERYPLSDPNSEHCGCPQNWTQLTDICAESFSQKSLK